MNWNHYSKADYSNDSSKNAPRWDHIFILQGFIALLILSSLTGCAKKTITEDQLQIRNGLAYEINSDNPFSGKVNRSRPGIHYNYEELYDDGLLNGAAIRKYESGQTEIEANFVKGKLSGLYREYYDNGQKKFEVMFRDNYDFAMAKNWLQNGEDAKAVFLSRQIMKFWYLWFYPHGEDIYWTVSPFADLIKQSANYRGKDYHSIFDDNNTNKLKIKSLSDSISKITYPILDPLFRPITFNVLFITKTSCITGISILWEDDGTQFLWPSGAVYNLRDNHFIDSIANNSYKINNKNWYLTTIGGINNNLKKYWGFILNDNCIVNNDYLENK